MSASETDHSRAVSNDERTRKKTFIICACTFFYIFSVSGVKWTSGEWSKSVSFFLFRGIRVEFRQLNNEKKKIVTNS